MNIDLNLINDYNKNIEVDVEFKVDEDLIKGAGLIYLNNVHVSGFISRQTFDYKISLQINGNYGLPCSITMEPVDVPFIIEIDKYLEEISEEFDKNLKISENTLDIFPIIWENVLVEIPMKVTSPNASLDKNFEYVSTTESEDNPELAKLKDLL